MARRVLFIFACALLLAAPAAGEDIYRKKREIDERISSLQSRISHAKAKEGVLTGEITIANAKIDSLVDDVERAQARLDTLEHELAASQRKLDRVTELYGYQTKRLKLLRNQYGIALARLERRLIDAYETPQVSAVDVMLASTSMSDMLSQIEYLRQVDRQDQYISDQLHTAKKEMFAARERTHVLKQQVAEQTAEVQARVDEQHTVTEQIISSQQQLATARDAKRATLSSIRADEKEFVDEVDGLRDASAAIAAKIRAASAQSSSGSTSSHPSAPSSAGLIWPVEGPVTSGFGWRWGRLHEGIDIGVPYGTAIMAAASGTVIYAGWMSGYGNLVIIDHGNGLATAYGHQSSIAAGNGAPVGQGQVIGYVGCTGHCFGPHLHFEVRINGSPVDPLGYL